MSPGQDVDVSKGLLTQKQVADMLACSTREVRRIAERGDLTTVPMGSRPKYLRAEVEALIAEAITKSA